VTDATRKRLVGKGLILLLMTLIGLVWSVRSQEQIFIWVFTYGLGFASGVTVLIAAIPVRHTAPADAGGHEEE
jgi:cyanate permease